MRLSELTQEMLRLSRNIDAGVQAVADQARNYADAERDYRRGQAQAWLQAPDGTVAEKQAWVDGECADLRHARDLAEGMRRAADLALRSRQSQLSALQTVARSVQAELDHSTYGTDFTP